MIVFFWTKKKASNMADMECYILRIWVLTLVRACMSNNLLNLSPYYMYHIPKVYLVENISFSGVRKLIHQTNMFKILLPKNISFFTGCNISYNIGLSLYVMISVFLSCRIWQIYDQEIFEGFTCFNFLKPTC